jgi:hypothetical protein
MASGAAAAMPSRLRRVRFTLPEVYNRPEASAYRMVNIVMAHDGPDLAVEVSINGHRLGAGDGIWESSTSFAAWRELLRPDGVNMMTFDTANAGLTSGDARELGFALMGLRIEAAGR